MEERAVRGVPWTLVSYAGPRLLYVLMLVALARLLAPSDLGIFALATLIINAIGVLKDLGLGSALVVRQDLDEGAQGTMLTLVIASSTAVALAVVALAPVAGALFDEPRLPAVVAVLAVNVVPQGVAGFFELLLRRELEFRRRFFALLSQSVTVSITSVALAALGAGVWSIVVGQIAGSGVLLLALVLLAPYRIAPAFRRAEVAGVLRAGRGFLLQGAVAFLRQNVDYLAVGRVLGARPLGFYSVTYRLAELPNLAIAEPIAHVTFPAFARARARGEQIGGPFLSAIRVVGLVVVPIGFLLSACAEPFTLTVLGEKWRPVIDLFAIFGLWAVVRPLETTVGWLLNSIGEADVLGRAGLGVLILLVPGLFLAADIGGTDGVAWGMLASDIVSFGVVAWLAHWRAGIAPLALWRALRPVLLAGAATWLAAGVMVRVSDGWSPELVLAAAVPVGLAAYLAVIVVLDRGVLVQALALAKRSLGVRRGASASP